MFKVCQNVFIESKPCWRINMKNVWKLETLHSRCILLKTSWLVTGYFSFTVDSNFRMMNLTWLIYWEYLNPPIRSSLPHCCALPFSSFEAGGRPFNRELRTAELASWSLSHTGERLKSSTTGITKKCCKDDWRVGLAATVVGKVSKQKGAD